MTTTADTISRWMELEEERRIRLVESYRDEKLLGALERLNKLEDELERLGFADTWPHRGHIEAIENGIRHQEHRIGEAKQTIRRILAKMDES